MQLRNYNNLVSNAANYYAAQNSGPTANCDLVIIDSRVDDLEFLITEIDPDTEILVLHPHLDGISQISAALAAYPHLSSFHLVSHGSSGSLSLGNTQLNLHNLAQYSSQLKLWSETLENKDFLLYGCEVALGEGGSLFLEQLHQLTGASIAASTAKVGYVEGKSNWDLNARVGTVNTLVAFSSYLQENYRGHFVEVTSFSVDPDVGIETEGTEITFNFTLDEAPPPEGVVVVLESSETSSINRLDLQSFNFGGLTLNGIDNFSGADVSNEFDFSAFALNITQQNASFSGNLVLTETDESLDGPNNPDIEDSAAIAENVTWTVRTITDGELSVAPSTYGSAATVTGGSLSDSVIYADDPSQVTASEPVVSLTSDVTTLVEDEGTVVTLNFALSEAPPDGGIELTIDSGKFLGLGDFDVFSSSSSGGSLTGADSDNRIFTFQVNEQTATLSVPLFDDQDRVPDGSVSDPEGDLRNDDQGEELTTFTLVDGEGYSVDSNASSITLTLLDTHAPDNTSPVADNDSYTTPFDTELVVNAAAGVLEGDTDAEGDNLTATLVSQPSNGTLTFNDDGSLSYTPNAGFSGTDSFTYTANDFELDSDPATVEITVEDEVITNEAPITAGDSYTTAFDTELTVDVADGVLSNDSDPNGDDITASVVDAPSNGTLTLNDDGSLSYTPNAGFSGTDSFTYTANDGELNSDPATVEITVEDEIVVGDPVVSFSTTSGTLSEVDGPALVLNFSVDGIIPPEGITVNLEGDTAEILQQFLAPDGDGAVQTRVTDDGNIFYRFDTSFEPGAGIEGGTLDVFSLEDGDPAEDNSDPAAAGTGFLSNFSFTILEENASITLPVSDDIVQEVDQPFSYALVAGDGYEVDSTQNSGTFTVSDGVTSVTSPTVGVTASGTTLIEDEQTRTTVTFTTEGDIPSEGLLVQLQGPPRSIAEFDVNATNPRNPESETVVEGPVVTGGNIAGTDEVAGSVFFRITDPTATINIAVFDDDVPEGTENFSFSLVDGEEYEVDAANSGFDITIEDEGLVQEDPVLSFTASTDLLNEAEGTPLSLDFNVDGDFPEEGIIVRFDENFFDTDQIDFNVFELENLEFAAFEETSPGRFTIDYLLSAPTGSLTTAVFDDNIAEEPGNYNPGILPIPDANYTINPDAQSVDIAVIDGVDGTGGPIVDIFAEPAEVNEGEQLTITLTTTGEIPEGGVEINVDSVINGVIGEFITTDEAGNPQIEVTGFAGDLEPNGDASGFIGTIVDINATITFDVFDDGETEGLESFEFNLLDGEDYDLGANTSFNVSINDGIAINQIDGTDGNDRLNGTAEADIIIGADGADRINGNGGNDIISGGDDLDRLNGNAGNDSIFGGADSDRINGGAGDDLLSGDAGDDSIRGGAGDDLLMGVTGSDTLVGEGGSDTFVFGNDDGTDRVNDFDPSEDKIGLVEGELTFADISLTQQGNNTILGVSDTGEQLALLVKVDADEITEDSFVSVPDISNIDDVI
ncbi:MAG: DUF4347 domain-containing protein [Pleurocapsa sp.]